MIVQYIFDSKIPGWFGVTAITLYPFVLFNLTPDEAYDSGILSHEMIHVEQVRRIGWWRFYGAYVWWFIKARLAGKSHAEAYETNPMEVEAYEHQDDLRRSAEALIILTKELIRRGEK